MNESMRDRLAVAVCMCVWLSPWGLAAEEVNDSEVLGPIARPDAQDSTSDEAELSEDERLLLEQATAQDAAESSDADAASGSTSSAAQHSVADDDLNLALVLDVAGAYFSDEPEQAGAHDPGRTGFTFQQLELSAGANVDPFFRFDTSLVFSEHGVEVEEAFATATALPGNLQLRAGLFLTRFGRKNPTHPHSWAFVDLPVLNGKFLGPEGSRSLGAEASWLAPLPWYLMLSASASMASGRSFLGETDFAVHGVDDLLYAPRLEQFFALGEAWSLLWGISALLGPNASGPGNRTEIYGSDVYLRWRPPTASQRTAVSLQLEGAFRTRQVPRAVLQDLGGYATLLWEVSPRWQLGTRGEWVQGLAHDPADPSWTSERVRAALVGAFRPSHHARLRLQLARDSIPGRTEAVWAAMLNLETVVGAHGAHVY